MKKYEYEIAGLDCAACANEIQEGLNKNPEIKNANVNFAKMKLTYETDTLSKEEIEKIVQSIEPEVELLEVNSKSKDLKNEKAQKENRKKLWLHILRLVIGAIVAGVGLYIPMPQIASTIFIVLGYAVLLFKTVKNAVKLLFKSKTINENLLITISCIGAYLVGKSSEGLMVIILYEIGKILEEKAINKTRKSISDLMDIRPDCATVRRNGELITISPESVAIGEIIIVKPGEKIPLDGVVLDGDSMLDTRALTGESVPRSVHKGDEALSGCMNQTGVLTIKTTKAFGESTASKIIDLVENASSRKAPTENFITTFARYYTPVVVILAAILAILPPILLGGGWTEWIRRGFVFLVVSCPCALVISIPLTFFGGIGAASKRGVLVKGSNYLEALNNVSIIVFDKTGTLTKGVFNVTDILPANGFSKEQVLEYAVQAESFSNHPIAKSILAAYGKEIDQSVISDYKEISGYGISAMAGKKKVYAGNTKLMDSEHVEYTACEKVGTKVYVAVDGQYAGCILITDEVKPDSKKAISDLKHIGVEKTVMLTGDDEKIGKAVAEELQLDEYYAQLFPDQKVEKVELLDSKKRQGSKLAFVGDGINDAPVLARADVGIAMGGLGSDAAIEAADVVLMTDEPSKLVDAIEVAKATKQIVMQNIVIALGIKSVFLILGALGIAGMWEAVFGDVGVTIIAVLNAMRILKE